MTNCPNCTAPITSSKCPYCGTVFEEPDVVTLYADNAIFAQMQVEKLYSDAIHAMRVYSGPI